MSIKQKAIRAAIWSVIQNWGSQAGSLLVFFVLARLLTPTDFGLVALANVFLAFMQLLLNQGFAQAIIQREELDAEHLDTAFWTNLGIGAILTVIGFGSASWVADLFKQPQLIPILEGLSFVFVLNSLSSVQQAYLERKFAFRATAVRSLIAMVVSGIVGVGLAFFGYGVWSLVAQQLAYDAVAAIVLWSASDWRPHFRFSGEHFQHLFSFGISILGFNFLSFINTRSDDFLIGYFLGTESLGYYSVAYRILTVMSQLLIGTSKQVALPTFSRLQLEPDRFRNAFYAATELTSAIAFPVFLGNATLAPEIVRAFFGEQWLPSVPVMQVLSFVGLFRTVTYFKSSVFMALGKPSWNLWLGLLSCLLNVTGFAIAVRWGIVAVAYAYLFRAFVLFPIGQWAISLLIKMPLLEYLQQFLSPLLSALTMAAILWMTKAFLDNYFNSYLILVIGVAIAPIIYGTSIRLLAPKLWQKLLDLASSIFSSSKEKQHS